MIDFYSYERVESMECTEELHQEALYRSQAPEEEISQEASCSSQAPYGEISSDGAFHPPPAFCFLKTKWVLLRGHANAVDSRNFLDYITIKGTINFFSLCHSGLEGKVVITTPTRESKEE